MQKLEFKNGDTFPNMGLGTWLSKKNEVYNAVIKALEAGYRHIDCAYIYGNEAEIGDALQTAFLRGLVKREDLFITSKLWNNFHKPEHVLLGLEQSLKALKLDYLDLYLIHWPIVFKPNAEQAKVPSDLLSLDEIPLAKTWEAMEQLVAKGLTKHIGVSNFNIPKLANLIENSNIAPEVNQIELHPYFQQDELVEFCQVNNILLTAYSPLGSRHLIKTDAGIDSEELVKSIAQKNNCSPSQVLLAWGMQRNYAVIPKSVNDERIAQNFAATKIQLDADDMAQMGTLNKNMRLAKGAFAVMENGPYTLESIWEK